MSRRRVAAPCAWTSPIRPRAHELADAADGADYLVNSHGIILVKSIFDITPEDWRKVQTVNAEAVFFLCQQIGPRLKPGGAIVNLSSSSAKLAATVEVAAYAASKDDHPVDHPLVRLCARVAAGAGQCHLPRDRRHADAGQ
jgi:NAD(P)-dependent dehydrogenase (short-subunit alcohol dehydrogenase family)